MSFLKSLHSRLLAWLIFPLLFMSGAHLASTYFDTRKTSEEIFDKLLVTLALSISEHTLASGGDVLTDDVLELIRTTTNDNLYYKVIGPDASFIMGYEDIPEPAGGINVLESNLRFYDARYLEQEVRIIAVSTLVEREEFQGWMTTFVAQTLTEREAYISGILRDSTLRLLLTIVIASMLMWVGITLGLRPLKRLRASVSRRKPGDLTAINSVGLPTELSALASALNELLKRLTDHVSLTKRFVENAAHELRTPVTALLPQTELAFRRAESDREREAVGKIKSSAERIARLTQQLLSLTYAESINLDTQTLVAIDLARISEDRGSEFHEQHSNPGLNLKFQPASIQGNEVLIGEIIDNLLDNAHKYGESDHPISISTYTKNNNAFLDITNAGDGIPESDRERVTERFVRGSQQPSGSGIGLSIVKEIVELHGGQLIIMDPPDFSGTLIRCQFPAIPL